MLRRAITVTTEPGLVSATATPSAPTSTSSPPMQWTYPGRLASLRSVSSPPMSWIVDRIGDGPPMGSRSSVRIAGHRVSQMRGPGVHLGEFVPSTFVDR
jgi:hypothetical protein